MNNKRKKANLFADKGTRGGRSHILDFDDPEVHKTHRIKSAILKVWGFSQEKNKAGWERYLMESENLTALYVCLNLFSDLITKYIVRKREKAAFIQGKLDKPGVNNMQKKDTENLEEYMFKKKVGRKSQRNKYDDEEHDWQDDSNYYSFRNRSKPKRESFQVTCEFCNDVEFDENYVVRCANCQLWWHWEECLGFDQKETEEWNCTECVQKLAANRATRSTSRRLFKMS